MKTWIVRETGEVRPPRVGEYYYCDTGIGKTIERSYINYPEAIVYPIISITEAPTRKEMRQRFEDDWWIRVTSPDGSVLDAEVGWLGCYDILFPPSDPEDIYSITDGIPIRFGWVDTFGGW